MIDKATLHWKLMWWGIATLALVPVLVVWADIPIAVFFHDHRDTTWVAFFAAITDFANGVIWYSVALVGIVAAALRHSNKAKVPNPARLRQEIRAWLFMAVSMASSGILINVMKFSIGRQRPKFLFNEGSADFHPFELRIADSSFPSGHTQSIWTAMLALSFIFPGMRPLFLVVAATIALSRIVVGAHYLADVVMSIFIAFATVLLWRQWFTKGGVSVTLVEKRFMMSA